MSQQHKDFPFDDFRADDPMLSIREATEAEAKAVAHFVDVLRSGGDLPAIVAWDPGNGQGLVIIDGHRRFKAFEEVGRTGIDVYAVRDIDDARAFTMGIELNLLSGTLSRTEMRHGARKGLRLGISEEQIAKACGMSVEEIREFIK